MIAAHLPEWASIAVGILALAGAALSFLGAVGLCSFKSFYERVHAPTLGATLGMGLIVVASVLFFAIARGRLAPSELLIGLFLTVTTPVTLILLARAALFRDRTESAGDPVEDRKAGG